MITPDAYRQIMANWATGVTVVTTIGKDGSPRGLTVSSFTSVSLEPTLILVCLDHRVSGLQDFKESMKFGVSILCEGQEDLSRTFARRDTPRPAELYFEGKLGIPLLRNALATLECETVAIYPGGDHLIFLGQVEHADLVEAKAGTKPLLYCRGKYERLP
jgi:flavin reductase (DIM6/NTAB) family NADH-FMN oxidoreductase RutF